MPQKKLNANHLKLIAILAMTIDHAAWLLFPGYPREALPLLLHLIGRLTCPIMCYFIAEGYHYTRDVRRYTARLTILALVSHFAYVFASNGFQDWHSFLPFYYGGLLNQTGVVWSLLGGLLMLRVCDSGKLKEWAKILLVVLICLLTLPADWSCIAALCILSIGQNRGKPRAQILWCLFYVGLYALVYCLAIDPVYGLLQLGVVLSVPLLKLYNGKLGENPAVNRGMKWFFYLYYPLHLFLIGVLRELFF